VKTEEVRRQNTEIRILKLEINYLMRAVCLNTKREKL